MLAVGPLQFTIKEYGKQIRKIVKRYFVLLVRKFFSRFVNDVSCNLMTLKGAESATQQIF